MFCITFDTNTLPYDSNDKATHRLEKIKVIRTAAGLDIRTSKAYMEAGSIPCRDEFEMGQIYALLRKSGYFSSLQMTGFLAASGSASAAEEAFLAAVARLRTCGDLARVTSMINAIADVVADSGPQA